MRSAILIGVKGDNLKPISDVLPMHKALEVFPTYDSSKALKEFDAVELHPIERVGVRRIVKSVVVGRETYNTRCAEQAAEQDQEQAKPKRKGTVAAAVAIVMLLASIVVAQAQQDIAGVLYTATISGTNANNSGAMQWRPNDVLTIQAWVTSTNAVTTDLTVTVDESLGGSHWSEGTQTFDLDCSGGASGTITLVNVTNSLGTLWWRIGQIERASSPTNAVTISEMLVYKPDE